MDAIQIRLKIYILKDIPINQIQAKTAMFIDTGFAGNEDLIQMHEENRFKPYTFDMLYPQEASKIYKKGNIYTVTIRTIDRALATYFLEICVNHYTDEMKGLTAEVRIIPKKTIECLYTLTPAVIKGEKGYWRTYMSISDFEERLRVNLIKKWNYFENDKLPEDFQLYTLIQFLNDGPIAMEYKGIKLLGDKLRIQIADNETAQKLAYLALGTGICEMNTRGAGFVNYRWL
ncbi:MAG: CRISPR-associated endoribonuclease Cas6 [Lachnospiraceae bacterium]|nr:CRISPR-associated endoribonuclease Cas6 [Lachnospiraceae bacterium]